MGKIILEKVYPANVLVKPIFFRAFFFFATGVECFDIFVVKTQQGFVCSGRHGVGCWNAGTGSNRTGKRSLGSRQQCFRYAVQPDRQFGNAACQLRILDDLLKKDFFIYCFSRNDPVFKKNTEIIMCHATTPQKNKNALP